MSLGFFIVGAVIFAIYVWFTLWIIVSQNKKQREENYPTQSLVDNIDMDGHGNYGRFPQERPTKKKRGFTSKRKNEFSRRS